MARLYLLYTTHPQKLLSVQNPLCGNLILCALSVRLLENLIFRGELLSS